MTANKITKVINQNVLLIGAGPHAEKVYLPWLKNHGFQYRARLVAIVELNTKLKKTKSLIDSLGIKATIIGTEKFSDDKLPISLGIKLRKLAVEKNIRAIIISTEPSAHKPYALWALENGISVLIDKPITAQYKSRIKKEAANSLVLDYEELSNAYRKMKEKHSKLIFSVCSQRRYHLGFEKINQYIVDVLDKTNCPITSIQSSHADGQWRLPNELVDIDYHGFKNGYGKASHSGYHFFDLIAQLIKLGVPLEKKPTHGEVYSLLTTPQDYLRQLTVSDYTKFFSDYKSAYTQSQLEQLTKNYGEVNVFSLINLTKNFQSICSIQLSLLHNSLSRRSWIKPNMDDLYKSNGRIKHEQHTIQQGPFQSIQLHSYQIQTNIRAEDSQVKDYEIGGRNHLDIFIFRNNKIVGGKAFEKISINQIMPNPYNFELHTQVVKSAILEEFFDYLNDKINRASLKSDLSTHKNSVSLMSAIYSANAQRLLGENPTFKFEWQN